MNMNKVVMMMMMMMMMISDVHFVLLCLPHECQMV